jgi:signal transduction histidine kinase
LRIAESGAILHANQAAGPLLDDLGCEAGGAAPAAWQESVRSALGTKATETFEVEHRGQTLSFSVVPVPEGSYTNWYGRDITERRRLEREVLAIGERERERIGQDLHDGLGQHLTGAALRAKSLERKLAEKSLPEAADAALLVAFLSDAIEQTRALVRGLCPVKPGAGGFCGALRELASRVQQASGVSCCVECDERAPGPRDIVAMQLYRIAQEAVTNAVKHARARHVVITLGLAGGAPALTVRDDGVGIPASEIAKPSGLGLAIMRYRASAIGASIGIRRDPAGGTIVTCLFAGVIVN